MMSKIFLWSGHNPIALGIKWFTGSNWSHTGFILPGDEEIIDSDFSLDPWKNGVRVRSFKSYLEQPDRLKIIDLPFSKEENKAILKVADSYVGNAVYDLPLVFSFIWEWWEGDKAFENMVHLENAFTCSEFVAHCIYKATGRSIVNGVRHNHSTRPHELEVLETWA